MTARLHPVARFTHTPRGMRLAANVWPPLLFLFDPGFIRQGDAHQGADALRRVHDLWPRFGCLQVRNICSAS
jgi:hypothetical protein